MNWQDVVSNVTIFGLDESSDVPGVPVVVEEPAMHAESGEDSFLNGVIVQFDLTFTNKAWVEAERYHFLDFVSTQSTIHRITNVDLDTVYIEYVDPRIIEIMKEKASDYNGLQADIRALQKEGKDTSTLNDAALQKYLELLYSNPAGFKLTARMTANYRELRMIYFSRRNNRLPEWRAFCRWIETLPRAEYITNA
ncbi:MAG: hypothetical protein J6S26_02215 [Solobacterium sp.]|nr:hypothetical protein [Solobacterium sp.]